MTESVPYNGQNTTTEKRTQLKHLLLDVDFLHKPTVKAFRASFGWVGIPWLLEMYALMSRATNARVDPSIAIPNRIRHGPNGRSEDDRPLRC